MINLKGNTIGIEISKWYTSLNVSYMDSAIKNIQNSTVYFRRLGIVVSKLSRRSNISYVDLEIKNLCELKYECLYEEGIALYNKLSDADFKKPIRKQYNYINQIAKRGFY